MTEWLCLLCRRYFSTPRAALNDQPAAQIPDEEFDRWERETGEHRDSYPLDPAEYCESTAATLSPEDEKRPVVGFLRLAGWPESEIVKVVEAHKRGETPTYKVTL